MQLFPNHGAQAVAQSYMVDAINFSKEHVSRLKNCWSSDEKRRNQANDLQRMYDHDWESQLEEELEKRFRPETAQKLKQLKEFSLNILHWFVRRVSGVYKKPARWYVEGFEGHERIEQWLSESMHAMGMLTIDRLTTLHQDCLIGPYVQTKPDGTKRLQYRILTPDTCTVMTRDGEPSVMEGLLYQYEFADAQGKMHKRFVYWDDANYREFDKDWQEVQIEGNEEGINPYGRIPFVVWHAGYDTQKLWHGERMQGLRRITLSAGTGLSDFWHSLKNNSFKQIGLSGPKMENLDPGAILDGAWPLDLGESGQAQVLDLTVNQMQHIEAIWQVVSMVVHTYGLNPKTFRGAMDATSGYQLEVQNQDLTEIHAEKRILYAAYEQELYDVVRAVNNEHPEFAEMPEGKWVVEFEEVGPGKSPQELLDFWGQAVEKKLSTHVRAIMALHDLTEEEAQEEWAKIQEEQKASSPLPMFVPEFGGDEEPEEDAIEDEEQSPILQLDDEQ